MEQNERENVVFARARSSTERHEVAGQCCARLRLSMPTVVDTMDNKVDAAYAGWPERLFVISADGRIAYAGDPGPFGFDPGEVRRWLKKNSPPG